MATDDRMIWIGKWEELKKLAYDNDFYVMMDRHSIELRAGILKANDCPIKLHQKFRSLEELEAWLNGALWQRHYSEHLGWDQKRAETEWRDDKDRQRILDVLSRD